MFHYQCPIKRSVDVRQSEILNKRAVRSPLDRKWGRLFIFIFALCDLLNEFILDPPFIKTPRLLNKENSIPLQ